MTCSYSRIGRTFNKGKQGPTRVLEEYRGVTGGVRGVFNRLLTSDS